MGFKKLLHNGDGIMDATTSRVLDGYGMNLNILGQIWDRGDPFQTHPLPCLPFVEVLTQISNYAKPIKEIMSNKKILDVYGIVSL